MKITLDPLRSIRLTTVLLLVLLAVCGGMSWLYWYSQPVIYAKTGTVRMVKTGEGFQLLRHGRPFHVRGAAGTGHLTELRASGGNTIRVYRPDSLERILGQAEALGLAVIADIPLPKNARWASIYGDSEAFGKLRDSVRTLVTRYRDHPALLCWMLGNEIVHPYNAVFQEKYGELVDLVRSLDPNHPISTTLVPWQLATLTYRANHLRLDFLSFNVFGSLRLFRTQKLLIPLLWRGPYLISEWGVNGPWEVDRTLWKAPIESTSTKKAEHLRLRYPNLKRLAVDGRNLGDLLFYWGWKHERTPTWFSLFSPDSLPNEVAFAAADIWQDTVRTFPGPAIDYLLMDGRGAADNIMLATDQKVDVSVRFAGGRPANPEFRWELLQEDWHYGDTQDLPPVPLRSPPGGSTADRLEFLAPQWPGPYRLYLYVRDSTGYLATANVPFYVLSAGHAK